MSNTNKRTFTVSPHIIFSLIKAQAGSLGKAVLECVMNSVDAGATSLEVTVTNSTLKIVDNGKGFASRAEIEACFEVFGFEHHEGDRTYGQFGIGRAQLWNFCSTLWCTNTFSMDVDIKNRGLDYDLKEGLMQVEGLTITGKFYEKLKTSELLAFEKEIAELALYAQVPLTVNGKLINRDPATEKWTHETADAWIRLKETGELTVYNLGVKVRNYPAYVIGSGGLVVTKPGVRLALNMARNDILTTECSVWKRVKPFLQKKSDERVRTKSVRLTDDELQNLVARVLAGEANYETVAERKLITDIQGKNVTLDTFLRALRNDRPCTVAPLGKRIAERAHVLGYAFVVRPVTLERFGVETPSALCDVLQAYFTVHRNGLRYSCHPTHFEDDYQNCVGGISEHHVELPVSEHKAEERAFLKAASDSVSDLLRAMLEVNASERPGALQARRLTIGESETAQAWTDGHERIVLNRTLVAKARQGLPGVLAICNVLLHEYLHEGPDTGTHEHDMVFYERFESVTTDAGVTFGEFCFGVYRRYLLELRRRQLKILTTQIQHADMLDMADELVNTIPATPPDGPDMVPAPRPAVVSME